MTHPGCRVKKQIHLLDDTLSEWRLLQQVQPIFSVDRAWNLLYDGQTSNFENPFSQSSRSSQSSQALLNSFVDGMSRIPVVSIETDLECQFWDECLRRLKGVLRFLESLVKEAALAAPTQPIQVSNVELSPSTEPDTPSWTQRVRDWGLVFTSTSGTASRTPSAGYSDFPKLEALSKLQWREDYNTALSGQHYLELLQSFRSFKEGCSKLTVFNGCMKTADKSGSFRDVGLSTIPRSLKTNWKAVEPSNAGTQLYDIIRQKIQQCEYHDHEAWLRMDGFTVEELSFEMFMVSCRERRLQEARFMSLSFNGPIHPEGTTFVLSLCQTIRQYNSEPSPVALSFYFEDDDEEESNGILVDLPGDEAFNGVSFDTSLEKLQKDKYFYRHGEGGIIGAEHKAVLELSLGRCLLHLLQSPWMEQPWGAPNFKFLRQEDSNKLLDFHYPYVPFIFHPGMESRRKNKNDCQKLIQYVPTITSFARLILEIETGYSVNVSDSLLSNIKGMNRFLTIELNKRKQRVELRPEVYHAIDSCLKFDKLLKLTRDSDPQGSFDFHVKKVVYSNVILQLERNLSTIEDYRKLLAPYNLRLQERSIEAVTRRENRGNRLLNHAPPVLPAGILGLPLRSSVDLGPLPREVPMQNPPANELAKFMMFDSELNSDIKDIGEAQTFWALHQIFYKKFIEPKGKTRKINSRRVRIAILDTGVAEEDPFLYTHIEQIRTARWERGRQEAEDARKAGTKLRCPPKRSFTPIKAKECFAGSKNGVLDTCGHGTITAGLFLRVAPEADIYVAKVAEDMEFKDTAAVAKAISWAASIPVDIISMSFGSRDYVLDIDVAMTQPPAGKPLVKLKFAAASNGGRNFPRTYPATDHGVIAVHAHTGLGGEGNMNPSAENEPDCLGTLGYGIRVSWKNKPEFRQGTSYACPIAAGIAANWLEWLEYVAARPSFGVTENEKNAWGSGFGVRKILTDLMGRNTAKLRYLAPWHLCPTEKENMQDSDIVSRLKNHPGL